MEIEVEVLRKKIEEDKSTKDSYEKEVENLNATLLKERLEREQVNISTVMVVHVIYCNISSFYLNVVLSI